MSGASVRDGAAVRIFPPGVPLLTIVAGVLLNRWWPIDPGFTLPARYWVGGLVVAGAFLMFGVWAVVLFRRTGQDEKPWAPTPRIVERGPFRVTRNPMYLQMVIGCIGFAIILMNVWILLLTPLCGWALQRFAIRPEEEYLERKFGDLYLRYPAPRAPPDSPLAEARLPATSRLDPWRRDVFPGRKRRV